MTVAITVDRAALRTAALHRPPTHCLVCALAASVLFAACRSPKVDLDSSRESPAASGPPVAPSAAAPIAPPPPPVTTDWCVPGLAALDEETCYVLPDEADAGAERPDGDLAAPLRRAPPLLVYLHGIIPPRAESEQKERVELAVLHAAKRAGAAALIPRGLRGIGPAQARDWWAWPTEPVAHAKYTAMLVGRWVEARRRLEAIAGAPFSRTYLAGSSNGAYFVTALALGGELGGLGFPVDGYGAMSGGSAGGRVATSLPITRRPFYVGYGAYDETTKASARALAALLAGANWPTRRTELPVGHGAREEYLDEAFVFWAQEAK